MSESYAATDPQANTEWEPWFDEYVDEGSLDADLDAALAPDAPRGNHGRVRFASALLVAGVILTTILYVAS